MQRPLDQEMRRRATSFVATLSALSLLLGCTPEEKKADPPSQKISVTFGGPQNISLVVLIARKQGFFDRHGIAATYQPLQNGKIVFDAVAAGQINVGLLVDANLAFLGFEGTRGVTTIGTVMTKTDDAIVARADRGIRKPADLAGRRIAYLPGTSSNALLRLYQQRHSIDLSRATLTPLSPPAMQAALVNGDVDAISAWQPFRFNAAKTLGAKAVTFNNDGAYKARIYLAVRGADVAAKSDAYERVLAALRDAVAHARANPDETINYLAGELGVEAAALRSSWGEYELGVAAAPDTAAHLTQIARAMVALEPEYRGRRLPDYSSFWSAPVAPARKEAR